MHGGAILSGEKGEWRSAYRYYGDDPDDFYFFAEYNFALIDDTYMMPSKDGTGSLADFFCSYNCPTRRRQHTRAETECETVLQQISELLSTVSPYNEDGTLRQRAKAYSDDYDVVYKNHPLKIMVSTLGCSTSFLGNDLHCSG